MTGLLKDRTHLEWLTEGWIMIMKDPQMGTIPSNYQLSTKWNLLSGIIAAKRSRNVAQYMSKAQKGW